MPAVIYTRVSRDTQNGRSVADQERECRAECDRRGWDVRAVYCDNAISASRYGGARPQWEKLKTDLEAGDVLVVWEASRTSRDLEEFVALRNLCAATGVGLSYSGRVLDLSLGDDRFTAGLDALLAERESEQIRVRVLRGKRAGAIAGRPAGRVPWGYRIATPGVWEPDPVEAPRVKTAVARILDGDTYSAVLRWLETTDGYTPPTVTVMRRSLAKPTLAGLRTHRGEVIGKGTWAPIITVAQHEALTRRMSQVRAGHRRRIDLPGPTPKHLLSHIAVCGSCAAELTWRRKAGAGKPIYVCPRGHCCRLADPLDAEVTRRLMARLAEVDPRQFDTDNTEADVLWRQLDELDASLADWTDKAIAGQVSAASFARIEKGILERVKQTRVRLGAVTPAAVDLDRVRQNWDGLPMAEKRAIVRGFFTITVHAAVRGRRARLDGIDITDI